MARVKDLWISEVPVRGADGKPLRDDTGHVVMMKKKTAKHPDRGGNKNAKRWLAIWANPDGIEDSKAFAKQADAEAHAKKMEADVDRGEYIDPEAGEAKFGPLAEKYLRLRDVGGRSHLRYEQAYRNQVEPTFAKRTIGAVKPSDVLEWLRSPGIAGLGQSAQGLAYMIVAGTFDLAVADKIRRDNPARNRIVPVPRQGDAPPRELWTPQQVWAVHDAHPARYRAVPACAAGLGTRPSEAFALAEEDFDFDAMKVHVQRQVVLVGRQWVFKAPKRGKDRWVPLSRGLAAIVRAHVAQYPPKPYELPWMDEKGKIAKAPHVCRLLFLWESHDPRTSGKHIHASSYDTGVWKPALTAAGIRAEPGDSGRSGNGPHMLRHFYSQALQDAGLPPAGVAEFLGHSTRQLPVTFRVYGHVTDKTYDQARRAIDKTLFRLRPVAAGTEPVPLRFRRAAAGGVNG